MESYGIIRNIPLGFKQFNLYFQNFWTLECRRCGTEKRNEPGFSGGCRIGGWNGEFPWVQRWIWRTWVEEESQGSRRCWWKLGWPKHLHQQLTTEEQMDIFEGRLVTNFWVETLKHSTGWLLLLSRYPIKDSETLHSRWASLGDAFEDLSFSSLKLKGPGSNGSSTATTSLTKVLRKFLHQHEALRHMRTRSQESTFFLRMCTGSFFTFYSQQWWWPLRPTFSPASLKHCSNSQIGGVRSVACLETEASLTCTFALLNMILIACRSLPA